MTSLLAFSLRGAQQPASPKWAMINLIEGFGQSINPIFVHIFPAHSHSGFRTELQSASTLPVCYLACIFKIHHVLPCILYPSASASVRFAVFM